MSSDQPVCQHFSYFLIQRIYKVFITFFYATNLCHQMGKVKEPCQRVGGQQYSVTDLLPLVAAAAMRVSTLSRHPKWLKMFKAHLFLLSKLFSSGMLKMLRQCDIQWDAVANTDVSPHFRGCTFGLKEASDKLTRDILFVTCVSVSQQEM